MAFESFRRGVFDIIVSNITIFLNIRSTNLRWKFQSRKQNFGVSLLKPLLPKFGRKHSLDGLKHSHFSAFWLIFFFGFFSKLPCEVEIKGLTESKKPVMRLSFSQTSTPYLFKNIFDISKDPIVETFPVFWAIFFSKTNLSILRGNLPCIRGYFHTLVEKRLWIEEKSNLSLWSSSQIWKKELTWDSSSFLL